MNQKKLSQISLLLILMLCSSLAGALMISPAFADVERVVNGGFETGNLTGWTIEDPPLWEGGVTSTTAHSGTYSLFLAQVDFIHQAFSPAVSTTGDLKLWAKATGDETYPLVVSIYYSDGSSAAQGIKPPGYWTQYTFSVDHTKLVSKIGFMTWEMAFPGYYVDDVSLMGPIAGYSATIWSWDYIYGWQIPVPITMDGAPTGYNTPHTFTGLTGTHTFTVPSKNSAGHPFSDWSTGWTDETITVSSAGTYTARYRAGYSATIWSWCAIEGWLSTPITMDGAPTGYNTPHTFTGLTGTHTFRVPSTDASGHPFYEWSTGWTGTTITVNSAGVYTARYKPAPPPTVTSFTISPNPFSPNGDGVKDTATIKATFNVVVKWQLQVRTLAGAIVRSWIGTGSSLTVVWNGRNSAGVKVADGTYNLRLSGADLFGKPFTTKWKQVIVDTKPPTVTGVSVYPTSFNPKIGQITKISYTLSESCYVTIKIYNSIGTLKRTLLNNALKAAGTQSVIWNGKDSLGNIVPPGTYTIKIWVVDKAGNKASPYPIIKTVKVL